MYQTQSLLCFSSAESALPIWYIIIIDVPKLLTLVGGGFSENILELPLSSLIYKLRGNKVAAEPLGKTSDPAVQPRAGPG